MCQNWRHWFVSWPSWPSFVPRFLSILNDFSRLSDFCFPPSKLTPCTLFPVGFYSKSLQTTLKFEPKCRPKEVSGFSDSKRCYILLAYPVVQRPCSYLRDKATINFTICLVVNCIASDLFEIKTLRDIQYDCIPCHHFWGNVWESY